MCLLQPLGQLRQVVKVADDVGDGVLQIRLGQAQPVGAQLDDAQAIGHLPLVARVQLVQSAAKQAVAEDHHRQRSHRALGTLWNVCDKGKAAPAANDGLAVGA